MMGQRTFTAKIFILVALLFIVSTGQLLASTPAVSNTQPGSGPSAPATATISDLSTLSDEQVRVLLVEKLQKDAAAEESSFSFEPEIKGPGAPLGKLLNSLNSNSVQSEYQLRKVWSGFPDLLPELYRLFISL